jgi:uncharacterized membrane-anchored protein
VGVSFSKLLKRHGLSLIVLGILALWIALYAVSNQNTHVGAFFGNAIADWSGSAAVIVLTKFLYESRSSESKAPPPARKKWKQLLYDHSLSIVLAITGIGWALLYAHQDSSSKWGQVTGNIVSEWVQMIGLVVLTKRFVEIGSKESR